MVTCCAKGCKNRSGKSGVTFHRFPKDSARKSLWIKALQRKDWEPSVYSKVCSSHFRESDIDRTSLSCVRIREGAVPSIFSSFPSRRKKVSKQRRTLQKPTEEITFSTHIKEEIVVEPSCSYFTEETDEETSFICIKEEIDEQPSGSQASEVYTECPTASGVFTKEVEEQPACFQDHAYTKCQTNSAVFPKDIDEQPSCYQENDIYTRHQTTSDVFPKEVDQQPVCSQEMLPKELPLTTCTQYDDPVARMKRKLDSLSDTNMKYRKKIKLLQQDKRRLKKRNSDLNAIIRTLQNKNYVYEKVLGVRVLQI